jgi:hypothetical protein
MRAALLAAVLTLTAVATITPALAAETTQATRLVVEVAEGARHGEPHAVTAILTDRRGRPLAGETVAVWEQVRLFDYTDFVLIAEVRTNHEGRATVSHVATAPGAGRITAEYAGSDRYAPADATIAFTIAEGVGVVSRVMPVAPDPLLPRGVTAAWFLVLLVGVWVALGATVYHLVRIPGEAHG